MLPVNVPPGTQYFIGAPAHPMPAATSEAIKQLVVASSIREAHLPQLFVPSHMEKPAQVLVLVIRPGDNISKIVRPIAEGLAALVPAGQNLDIWPVLLDDRILPDVRGAGCQLVGDTVERPSARRPWWKFW